MFTLDETRIDKFISMIDKKIKAKLDSGEIDQTKVNEMTKSLDMDFEEFAKFQQLKSLAMMNGKLSSEEAQQIYNYLGESPSHFNGQNLAVKQTLTTIFAELLK